jgi:predicted Zn finger-like uncharacterized protein
MIVECDRCYTRYRYDDSRFEGKASKRVRCTRCLAIFEIFNTPAFEAQPSTLAPARPEETVSRLSDKPITRKRARAARPTSEELKLPEDAKLSLAVIAGPEAGRIFPIEKPRVVIGRHDADINVDDPEISRQHAAVEIAGERAMVVDLGSTNGTFVGDGPVSEAPLENQSEFTIGGSTLMLIVTPKAS